MSLVLQAPWVGRARQWGAGERPCCAGPGAEADVPENWDGVLGLGAALGEPQREVGQGQQEPAVPGL